VRGWRIIKTNDGDPELLAELRQKVERQVREKLRQEIAKTAAPEPDNRRRWEQLTARDRPVGRAPLQVEHRDGTTSQRGASGLAKHDERADFTNIIRQRAWDGTRYRDSTLDEQPESSSLYQWPRHGRR
jgi:hypothetical protein